MFSAQRIYQAQIVHVRYVTFHQSQFKIDIMHEMFICSLSFSIFFTKVLTSVTGWAVDFVMFDEIHAFIFIWQSLALNTSALFGNDA